MNFKNIKLNASEETNIAGEGSYIFCISADAPIQVRAKNVNVILKAGQGVQIATTFKALDIKNTAAAINSVDVVIGHGEFISSELSGDVQSTLNIGTALNNAPVKTVTIAASSIIAANAARVALQLRNTGGSDIVLGGDGVSLANGATVLNPSEEITIVQGASAEWFGIASGANSDLAITEIL